MAVQPVLEGWVHTMMNDFLSGFLEELGLEICRGSQKFAARQSKFVNRRWALAGG